MERSVIENSSFKNYVSENRLNIWNALTYRDQGGDSLTVPGKHESMIAMLKDLQNLNVQTLGKIVSWVTQQTIGKWQVVIKPTIQDATLLHAIVASCM